MPSFWLLWQHCQASAVRKPGLSVSLALPLLMLGAAIRNVCICLRPQMAIQRLMGHTFSQMCGYLRHKRLTKGLVTMMLLNTGDNGARESNRDRSRCFCVHSCLVLPRLVDLCVVIGALNHICEPVKMPRGGSLIFFTAAFSFVYCTTLRWLTQPTHQPSDGC